MIKLEVITTDSCIFFSYEADSGLKPSFAGLKVNGFESVESYEKGWYTVPISEDLENPISRVERLNEHEEIDCGYFLEMEMENLPPKYSETEWEALGEERQNQMGRLYTFKRVYKEPFWEETDFEYKVLCHVKELQFRPSFSKYTGAIGGKINCYDDGRKPYVIDERSIAHDRIDRIMVPHILHPLTPASIKSDDLYKIIRMHIKEHIDPHVARITSDYDFCFSVVKVIKLIEPQYAISLGDLLKKPKKRQEPRVTNERTLSIFSMTPASQRYNSYPVLPNLTADNEFELEKKLDRMLEKLIAYINAPLRKCAHCDGVGYEHEDVFTLQQILTV